MKALRGFKRGQTLNVPFFVCLQSGAGSNRFFFEQNIGIIMPFTVFPLRPCVNVGWGPRAVIGANNEIEKSNENSDR